MKSKKKEKEDNHYDRLADEEDSKRRFYSSEKDPKNILPSSQTVPAR